ncbi:MAG: hypothetical protein FJX77_05345 [Armatimonadetes bacterium]|nr:hypothetical protein [Armatimonadota bacterium]
MKSRAWVVSLAAIYWLGVITGKALVSSPAPAAQAVAAAQRDPTRARVAQSRARVAADPSWPNRADLLRQLCWLREFEVAALTHQGIRPAEEHIYPTVEQLQLLAQLWDTADTPERLQAAERLEYRVKQSLRSHLAP